MRTDTRRAHSRGGFTLVELLVVITIIGMLMALLIPAVNAARGVARRNTCLNNMKQTGTGIIGYEGAKQRFPGYVQSVKRGPSVWVGIGGGGQLSNSGFVNVGDPTASSISWAGVITPYMDSQRWWDAALDPQMDVTVNSDFLIGPLESYICPSDTEVTSLADNAGLSFVINAGAWDRDNSGNYMQPGPMRGDTEDNGLAHNHITIPGAKKVKTNMSGIRDGAGSTLLLSENIQKDQGYCWFGVPGGTVAEQYFGMVWVVSLNPSIASQGTVQYQVPIGQEPTIVFPHDSPAFARPAANHGSSFNVIFAEGHGRALNNDIDYLVYQQLLTPNGRKCVDPVNHDAPTDPEAMAEFRTGQPLSASDLE